MVAWSNFCHTWARFVSLVRSKLRLSSANHRPGYWSNLRCDWPSTARAYFEQETENGPWCTMCFLCVFMMLPALHSVWKIAQVANWTNLVSSGARLSIKTVFPRYGDSHVMDRRSWDRLTIQVAKQIWFIPMQMCMHFRTRNSLSNQ